MKYHFTLANVLYSLLLVILIVSALMFAFVGTSSLLFDRLIDTLIDQLIPQDGKFIIDIGSVEPAMFNRIEVHDVHLYTKESSIDAYISSLTIYTPAFRFVHPLLYPKHVNIEVQQLDVRVGDLSQNEAISTTVIDVPFSVDLNVHDASLSYTNEDLQLVIEEASLFGEMRKDGFHGGSFQAKQISLTERSLGSLSSYHSNLIVQKRGNGELELITHIGPTTAKGLSTEVAIESGIVYATSPNLESFMKSIGELDLFSENVTAVSHIEGRNVGVAINQLEAHAQNSLHSTPLIRGTLLDSHITSEDLQLTIPSLKVSSTFDTEEVQGVLSLDDIVTIALDQSLIGEALIPSVSMNRTHNSSSYVADISFLHVSPSLLFDTPLPIDSLYLNRAHFLVIEDAFHQFDVESSFHLSGETSLAGASTITAEVALDAHIGSDTHSFNLYIEDLTSEAIHVGIEAHLSSSDMNYFTLLVRHPFGIEGSAYYDINDDMGKVSFHLNRFPLYSLTPMLENLAPTLLPFIIQETTLDAHIATQFNKSGLSGIGTTELGFSNVYVNEQTMNFAATVSQTVSEDAYVVDSATITTAGVRLAYSGTIDKTQLIPEGRLAAMSVQTGEEFVTADFKRVGPQTYHYVITPLIIPGIHFDGSISWSDEDLLKTDIVAYSKKYSYPFTMQLDTTTRLIEIEGENLQSQADLFSPLGIMKVEVNTTSLQLIERTQGILQGVPTVSSSLYAQLMLSDGKFSLYGDEILIEGLSWNGNLPWSLGFNVDVDRSHIVIDDVIYKDREGTLSGVAEIRNDDLLVLTNRLFDQFSFEMHLHDEHDTPIISSVFTTEIESHIAQGVISINQFDLRRIGVTISSTPIDMQLVGETDGDTHTLAYITLDGPTFSFDAHIDDKGIAVDTGVYEGTSGTIDIGPSFVEFGGRMHAKVDLFAPSAHFWKDSSSRISLIAESTLPPRSSLFDFIAHSHEIVDDDFAITLTHTGGSFFKDITIADGTHLIEYQQGVWNVHPLKGGSVSLYYDQETSYIDLNLYKGFPFQLHAYGFINKDMISLTVSDLLFDLTMLNPFFSEPVINFEEGLVRGEVLIDGPFHDPQYFGTLRSNNIDMTLFWTVGEYLSLKNPVVTISENLATVAPTTISINHTSGRSTSAVAQFEATLEKWIVPHYRIDVLEVHNPISFWLPIFMANVNVEAMVQGTFSIDGTPDDETLYGDIIASDAFVSIGTITPPTWYTEKTRTSIDMNFRTGKNVSFVYPNEESPILRATFSENQRFGVTTEAPSMLTTFSGEMLLRSGEIYYVQKNFYITEGSLKIPSLGTSLKDDVMPTVSLRARLREFDVDGSRIDIFMVLQDAPLDSIEPRFESIPQRDTNEILELLGQRIINPYSVQESGLQSFASVASTATDVITRLGVFQATTISIGFSTIIREALGLDVFTIRTNLLTNILFDTIPLTGGDTSSSPLARYLDNTTLYIGKFLFEELYLQGMLHLRKDPLARGSSFLANDLYVDTELSIEWDTPLATFSLFTQPEELSMFDLFDTMGFSVTKRFYF